MRFESVDGIGRICRQNIKRAGNNPFVRIIFQPVAKDDIAVSRAVHEEGNFRYSCKAVIFFHAVQVMFRPERRNLRAGIIALKRGVDRFKALCQKMSRPAGVINDFGEYRFTLPAHDPIQWQTVPDKAGNGNGRKELPFVLFESLIEQLFKEIAQRLQIAGADNPVLLKKLDHFHKDFSVLIE